MDTLNSKISKVEQEVRPIITKFLQEIGNSFAPVIDQISKELVRVAPSVTLFFKALETLPDATKASVLAMAENGWFFDKEMTLDGLFKFLSAHQKGSLEEMEGELIDHFEGRLNSIEKIVVKKYPHRKRILSEAFKAHRDGLYELSVPVFLSQADGISLEITNGKNYFMSTGRKGISKLIEEAVESSYKEAFLSPLLQKKPLPISAPSRKRGSHLNRHAVLHGEDVDYATKPNSLKAVSFLNYIAVVFAEALTEKEM